MSVNKEFTKENLDAYLKEVAREFRKRNGKYMRAEIILVGGAAILAKYGFRMQSNDIDAEIKASGAMKEAINYLGDKYDLPNGWLNSDFKKTSSYSPKLAQYSKHYRTYSNIVDIRIVEAEYLVAMKLKSGRVYKKDLSDVIGILYEHKAAGKPLTFEQIDTAVKNLYGSWDEISEYATELLHQALDVTEADALLELFNEQEIEEGINKKILKNTEKYTEEKITEDNIEDIIKKAKERQKGSTKKQTEVLEYQR